MRAPITRNVPIHEDDEAPLLVEYAEAELLPELEDGRDLDFERPLSVPAYDLDVMRHLEDVDDRVNQRTRDGVIFAYATEAQRVEVHNKRAARRGGKHGSLTAAEWLALRIAFGGVCAYCGSNHRLVLEHVRPLSCGGTTEVENVVLACWACNTAKGLKSPEEWLGPVRAAAFRERWAVALTKARDIFVTEDTAEEERP